MAGSGRPDSARNLATSATGTSRGGDGDLGNLAAWTEVTDHGRGARHSMDAEENKGGSNEPDVTFYTHGLCPYAQRVALTLEEKGVDYKSIHIDLSNKPSWYLSVNPRGLVPAVAVGGRVVTESLDICRYLDEHFPSTVPLVPQQAGMERLVSKADSLIHAGLAMVAGPGNRTWAIDVKRSSSGKGSSSKGGSSSRGEGDARLHSAWSNALDTLEQAMQQSQGPFLMGENVTLADVALFPFLARFQLVSEGIWGEAFTPDHPRVSQWMAAMWQRPSARRTFPDRDRFLLALKQYPSLDYFDYHSASLEDPVPKYWV